MAQMLENSSLGDVSRGAERPDDWTVVVCVETYEEATNAVDYLADGHFPVEQTAVAARDLTLVDHVAGRPRAGQAAMSGAVTGGFVGAVVGLLSEAFGDGAFLGGGVLGLVVGALTGLVVALAVRKVTEGRRPIAAESAVHADRYELLVHAPLAEEAKNLLNEWVLVRPSRRAARG
jgi:hypothetical protein